MKKIKENNIHFFYLTQKNRQKMISIKADYDVTKSARHSSDAYKLTH